MIWTPDLDLVRSGGMKQVFGGVYAAATLGILLRELTFGHTSQLAAVLRRHLLALAQRTRVLDGITTAAFVDIDSLLRPVYGHAKQGASFGHTKISGRTVLRRGLSPLATTICTPQAAPVIAGIRLRAGRAGSSRGAASMVRDAVATAKAAGAGRVLVRGDSAFGNGSVVSAARAAGAMFSVVLTKHSSVTAAIEAIAMSSAGMPGPRSATRTRSRTPTPANGSPTPRSPRSPTPLSPAADTRSLHG